MCSSASATGKTRDIPGSMGSSFRRDKMPAEVVEFESAKSGEVVQAVYEHPWPLRFSHWVNTVALFVMTGSGLQIFRAFPSFGAKIPQEDLLNWPKAFAIGGWLGRGPQGPLAVRWVYMC